MAVCVAVIAKEVGKVGFRTHTLTFVPNLEWIRLQAKKA